MESCAKSKNPLEISDEDLNLAMDNFEAHLHQQNDNTLTEGEDISHCVFGNKDTSLNQMEVVGEKLCNDENLQSEVVGEKLCNDENLQTEVVGEKLGDDKNFETEVVTEKICNDENLAFCNLKFDKIWEVERGMIIEGRMYKVFRGLFDWAGRVENYNLVKRNFKTVKTDTYSMFVSCNQFREKPRGCMCKSHILLHGVDGEGIDSLSWKVQTYIPDHNHVCNFNRDSYRMPLQAYEEVRSLNKASYLRELSSFQKVS